MEFWRASFAFEAVCISSHPCMDMFSGVLSPRQLHYTKQVWFFFFSNRLWLPCEFNWSMHLCDWTVAMVRAKAIQEFSHQNKRLKISIYIEYCNLNCRGISHNEGTWWWRYYYDNTDACGKVCVLGMCLFCTEEPKQATAEGENIVDESDSKLCGDTNHIKHW